MSYQISFVSGASLEVKISSLERRDLEEDVSLPPDISHQLSKFQFVRIVGLSRFWETNNKNPNESFSLQGYIEDVLTGLHGLSLPYAYLIVGEKRQLHFFKGVSQKSTGDVSALKTALTGSFPAIELQEPVDVAALDTILTNLPYRALMTGIPASKQITQEKETVREQIERLVRGLYGERWAYLVLAEPLAISFTTAAFDAIAAEIKQTYNTYLLKGTVDESNRPAQHYIVLLESALEQYQLGKSQGMWNVATYLFTSNPNTLGRGMALLRAVYAGESSLPEPIRVRPCYSSSSSTGHSQSQVIKAMGTNLNSKDLATLILLPKEEMPGFSLKDYARFDVSLPENKKAKSLAIGNVLLDGRSTGNWYEIECDDLAKHGLIVGVTGSGKTNTCFYLLHQLWQEHHIPFLVIEPAKSEYRDMMDVPGFEELRVFTLGDETVAPFRMNPFEVMPGVHVQSHIDYLKSLFFASFVLYAPMPYVLEQSLHEVYEDKGWNLALNENPRGTGSLSYPTLTDLYYKIEDVVERLGYEERITMDVRAGLRARINSLRIGGKGLMLDVRRSIPMQQLLEKPTVLELKQIGDDEEKAFLIGLYLMRLYEYYESQFKLGKQTQAHGLRHLTIIEEAHRLLKNVPTEKVSEESSNIKGKAVEAFSNILSEIRAYGEGILIAEQIPVKLAMDAIKNTNLKVMHRLVSQEDREVMGGTMNLDEAQKRYVASISCGTAAVYAEGMDSPLLVQAPNYKGNTLKRTLSDDVVRQQMQQRFLKHFPGLFVRFAECLQCQRHTGCIHHNIVKKMLDDSECREHFSRFLLTIVEDNDMMFRSYADFLRTVRLHATTKTQAEEREIAFCALLHIMERALEEKGQLYGWRYNETANLSKNLVNIFQKVSSGFQAIDPAQIQTQTQGFVAQFATDYRQLCQRERGHLIGCAFCQKVCLYQYEIAHLVKDKLLARDFEMVVKDSPDDNAMWISLANVCQNAAQRAVCTSQPEVSKAVALCFAAQKGAALKYSYAEQTKLVKNVLAVIDSQKS